MKKIIILSFSILLFVIFAINVFAKNRGTEIIFDNMTTKNFIQKSGYLPLNSIKKICSYDYCDYARGESATSTIEIFTKNYLSTIQDEEIRSSLKVKGIKITKLILVE